MYDSDYYKKVRRGERLAKLFIILVMLGLIAWWGGVAYVVTHFILKYW